MQTKKTGWILYLWQGSTEASAHIIMSDRESWNKHNEFETYARILNSNNRIEAMFKHPRYFFMPHSMEKKQINKKNAT